MPWRLLQLSLQQLPEKPATTAESDTLPAEAGASSRFRRLQHLPQLRLDLIVQQVRRHGFHVEHWADLEQEVQGGETWEALAYWCHSNDLKVSANHACGICFFESRYAYPLDDCQRRGD